jgi:hypothetical protein
MMWVQFSVKCEGTCEWNMWGKGGTVAYRLISVHTEVYKSLKKLEIRREIITVWQNFIIFFLFVSMKTSVFPEG